MLPIPFISVSLEVQVFLFIHYLDYIPLLLCTSPNLTQFAPHVPSYNLPLEPFLISFSFTPAFKRVAPSPVHSASTTFPRSSATLHLQNHSPIQATISLAWIVAVAPNWSSCFQLLATRMIFLKHKSCHFTSV